MPYAANNQISTDPIDGGIEISEVQYQEALDQIAAGKQVRVADGALSYVTPPPGGTTYWTAPAEEHQTAPGEEVPADATTTPPPTDYHVLDAGQWIEDAERKQQWFMAAIQSRAENEVNGGITVTVEGVDYVVATTASARTLIAGGKIRAEEAIAAGTSITRKITTDKGVQVADENQLVALFDLVEARHQAVMDRVEALEALVADGSITEADLDAGWP